MTEFSDQDLRDALAAERDETLRAEVVASFHGRQRWMMIMLWIVIPVIFAFSVWTAGLFFQTDAADVKGLVAYAVLFLWASVGVGLLKSWYYDRLNRNAILRAIHRLELRLAKREQQ